MSLVIVAVVLMLLAAIILPAVNYSRFQSRVVACQGNLQIAGMSLLQYADQHGGTHLTIPLDEKLGIAGFFGPQLLESGFVDDPVTFLCPGVSDDSRGNATSATRIPTLGQLESADGASLVSLQRRAGGDYAFSIGQQVDGHYAPTRNLGRPTYALLADAPSAGLPGRASANHGGKGQNVFFEDGQIRFLALPVVDGASIFENDLGIVAPGIHADDSVLAPSAIRIVKATSMLVD